MDPNTCMDELQALLEKYRAQKDRLGSADVQELVNHIESLDGWISRGGFLPTRWAMKREATKTKRFTESDLALARVGNSLGEFDRTQLIPESREIESFYKDVKLLMQEQRIR